MGKIYVSLIIIKKKTHTVVIAGILLLYTRNKAFLDVLLMEYNCWLFSRNCTRRRVLFLTIVCWQMAAFYKYISTSCRKMRFYGHKRKLSKGSLIRFVYDCNVILLTEWWIDRDVSYWNWKSGRDNLGIISQHLKKKKKENMNEYLTIKIPEHHSVIFQRPQFHVLNAFFPQHIVESVSILGNLFRPPPTTSRG